VGFCSDGTRALTGRHSGHSGVVSKVKEVAPDMNWVHCVIGFMHREALASKGMPPEFKTARQRCKSS
jgi:hypothetical protein